MDSLPFVSAFVLGLMGAGHCLGMCGGITAALSFAIPNQHTRTKLAVLFAYNFGRIASYSLFGAFVGYLGGEISETTTLPVLKVVSGVLLILMALYLADIWKLLSVLENAGSFIWIRIQPLGQKLMPVRRIDQALFLGMVWGWLPCGLVYSAVVYSSSQGSAISGAMIMFAFGLGTLPAVFMGGLAGQGIKSFLQKVSVRRGFAVLFLVFGSWMLWSALSIHPEYQYQMMCH